MIKLLKYITLIIALVQAFSVIASPKREFRGAWLHTVFQAQYKRNGTEQNKHYLTAQLDSLKAAGVNAVIFQVRPQADAFYDSKIEPWSIYLTDGGKAPVPFWDPLEFMVEETHRRGMELHAWLNPYRVTSNRKQKALLPSGHIYRQHPERFVEYGGKLYFDPGLPENREFICKVVDDIVSRYDIDGIHFDDYFYPYPIKGVQFPDDKSFAKYGAGMQRADWRRRNVDLLIEEVNSHIKSLKPWVRFGVSPFGIYRNKKTDPRGSDTNGLENYDALYADVLLWQKNGWTDYLIPQLYWELEHKAASYLVLVDWWNENAVGDRHIYIGQDVSKTMAKPDLSPSDKRSQLSAKVELTRKLPNISGNCWWPGYAISRNELGVADSLCRREQATKALVPAYSWLSDKRPHCVENIRLVSADSFSWGPSVHEGACSDIVRYGVYRFDSRSEIDTENSAALVDVIADTSYIVTVPGVYVITAIDRVNNESEPSAPIIFR